ncbi:MAG TPA: SBBP repeat-containing protein [Bryobacteraceae bacterium]|jgi:uncharacterized protein (TIGR03437 family)|nr:SBBP repeat-containing protein [Bryobacteraceae bacterium]
MRLTRGVALASLSSLTLFAQSYTISTFAGGALPVNVAGTAASLNGPQAVAVDKSGNVFFIDGNSVFRLDATTKLLTLTAGSGTAGFSGDNGLATGAQLNAPSGLALDSSGTLYIADTNNGRIRKITNGVITTVSGNLAIGGVSSQLYNPGGVAVDPSGNLYIADTFNNRVLEFSAGVITLIAGGGGIAGFGGDNGVAVNAQLNKPGGVAADSSGNLYIADSGNYRIRKVTKGIITTVAGTGTVNLSGDNGPAANAGFSASKIALDSSGNLYIADTFNNRIRKITSGTITTAAGGGSSQADGPAASAQIYPNDVTVDSAGNIYIAETVYANSIRKISSGAIATLAGSAASSGLQLGDTGPATGARLNSPQGIAVDSSGHVFIADTANNSIREVSGGVINTVAGNRVAGFSGDNGAGSSARLNTPEGVAVDSSGSFYIADTANNSIRKVTGGVITTVAGNQAKGFSGDNGPAASASLNQPAAVAVDSSGNLYIADTGNSRIRKVSASVITTIAGNGTAGFSGDGGAATSAQLSAPSGVALDSAGNLYIADTGNNRVRRITNGSISTIAGGGAIPGDNGPATSAQLAGPQGLAVDSTGTLYIADNNRIRKVAGGIINTIAGNGAPGFGGDNTPSTLALVSNAQGVAVDAGGNVYVADSGNNRIRLLKPGTPPAITPGGIVPNDSAVSVIQPGSWISIYGSNLANGNYLWNADFPTSLGGTMVAIDNRPAYLWVVSPAQINAQVPDDANTGLVSVAVTTGAGTATSTVTLAQYGPSFSLLGDGKHVAGEILTLDGSGAYGNYDLVGPANTFSYNTRPVKANETLTLFGVGFGPTTPALAAGQAFVGADSTTTPVTVTIGGVNAKVLFAGLSEAGLYQINLVVPASTGTGDQPLQATVNGIKTETGPVVTVQ